MRGNGSRRRKDRLIKAVIIIVTASLVLSGLTIGLFILLGRSGEGKQAGKGNAEAAANGVQNPGAYTDGEGGVGVGVNGDAAGNDSTDAGADVSGMKAGNDTGTDTEASREVVKLDMSGIGDNGRLGEKNTASGNDKNEGNNGGRTGKNDGENGSGNDKSDGNDVSGKDKDKTETDKNDDKDSNGKDQDGDKDKTGNNEDKDTNGKDKNEGEDKTGKDKDEGKDTDGTDNSEIDQNKDKDKTESDNAEDKHAPCFLSFTNAPIIKAGEAFDIHKYLGYADDVDRDVELSITGEVDVNTVGKYPLQILLTDDAGHTESRNMEVNVVAQLPPTVPVESKSEAFSDFLAAYKTEQTSVGIDVSRWQETIDFAKVKAAGCEFAYIRIGGLDDGELYTDRYYVNNIRKAKAAGLKVGIYWHAEEGSAEEVRKSAAYMLGVLGGEQLDLPIAYDWEDFKNFENYGMNLKDINDNYKIFAEEAAKGGYTACLYSSKFFLESVWSVSGAPIWLAHYTKATSYPGQYFMWQHSCTGRIDGIGGAVDLDVLYDGRL